MLPVWCRLWGLFLSTPSARRATFCGGSGGSGWPISIHALREEGDLLAEIVKPVELISIHALREEGDAFWLQRPCWVLLFLSTPSARRATSGFEQLLHHLHHFYPRPPRGGRRGRRSRRFPQRDFYPRPPRGGRLGVYYYTNASCEFLSTPSARRVTDVKATAYNKALISIHALREEGDVCWLYIRFVAKRFLSTPSARRATRRGRKKQSLADFYPRPPRGGRRASQASVRHG